MSEAVRVRTRSARSRSGGCRAWKVAVRSRTGATGKMSGAAPVQPAMAPFSGSKRPGHGRAEAAT